MISHDTDNAGHLPEEGDFVAYNYSGQIATGWVRHVGRRPNGRPTGNFTIVQLAPKDGHVSRVRGGAKCILVLEKAKAEQESCECPRAQRDECRRRFSGCCRA